MAEVKRTAVEKMYRLTVRIPESLVHKLKVQAAKDRTTVQEMVTEAIAALLKTARGGGKED
jgi:predicted DNA binding CopG/RHH family protein